MNLNKRQQLLAILAIVAVGFFVADKLIFTPLTNNWKARSERIVKLKKDFTDGTELLKRETVWREQWKTMQRNVLPNAKPEAESLMLKAFDRWSQEGGVAVSSIRPQWKEAQDDYKTLECRADVAGSLAAITKFLFQIERDPMGVKVDSMELQSRDAEGSQLALVIQVSGLVMNPPKQTKR
jgi:Tfp pilus assembly protein PilO